MRRGRLLRRDEPSPSRIFLFGADIVVVSVWNIDNINQTGGNSDELPAHGSDLTGSRSNQRNRGVVVAGLMAPAKYIHLSVDQKRRACKVARSVESQGRLDPCAVIVPRFIRNMT